MENELLTVLEYAEMKNVSVQSVYKRLKTGLKEYCVEIDGKKYIKRSALEQSAEQPEPKKEPDYSEDYVQSLLARIEGLEADKADLKAEKVQLQQEKEKMQQRIDEKDAHIMEITERLTVLLKNEQDRTALQAAPAAETVEVVQPADAAEPEQKKPWWKFW